MKIRNCIDEMGEKLKIAIQQDIYFTKVSGIEELSWKFIDCLVEDEIVDKKVLVAKPEKFIKINEGSPAALLRLRRRTPGSNKAISMMHPSLKDMALQNMVMSKEIEIHRKNQEQLKQENRQIEQEVQRLLRDPKTNTRYQMFPEFFPQREK
ncbi:unnamed protein product [Mytilus edulis]|uniref:Uncharacterized protein n=1 Tax=Mytilus edulis TaxID=6550 RepID=A0A8S3Q5Z3_MYTED|nr:unnamed protein product [Mytilus edulis]